MAFQRSHEEICGWYLGMWRVGPLDWNENSEDDLQQTFNYIHYNMFNMEIFPCFAFEDVFVNLGLGIKMIQIIKIGMVTKRYL